MVKVITLLALILGAVYWAQTQKLKSIAIRTAKNRCREAGVQLLDHTVVHNRRMLKKSESGAWRINREYCFEFTSTGEQRYTGRVVLQGQHVIDTELEPFSIN